MYGNREFYSRSRYGYAKVVKLVYEAAPRFKPRLRDRARTVRLMVRMGGLSWSECSR